MENPKPVFKIQNWTLGPGIFLSKRKSEHLRILSHLFANRPPPPPPYLVTKGLGSGPRGCAGLVPDSPGIPASNLLQTSLWTDKTRNVFKGSFVALRVLSVFWAQVHLLIAQTVFPREADGRTPLRLFNHHVYGA